MAHPLTRFISTVTVQDAIYWGNPTPGGYTSFDYGVIKEIKVRWDDESVLRREQVGEESSNRAVILVNGDLDVSGYIMLGSFGDIANCLRMPRLGEDFCEGDYTDPQNLVKRPIETVDSNNPEPIIKIIPSDLSRYSDDDIYTTQDQRLIDLYGTDKFLKHHVEIKNTNNFILLDGLVEVMKLGQTVRFRHVGDTFMINNIVIRNYDEDDSPEEGFIPQKIDTNWHPKGLTNAFQIKGFNRVPFFRSNTDFVRTATL